MSRLSAAAFLVSLLLGGSPAWLLAEPVPKVPAPQNVKIHSYNLKQVLNWEPVLVKNDGGNVVYEVEFRAYNTEDWIEVNCIMITETECNFTEAISSGWRVNLRVRAVHNNFSSDWVNTMDFQATRNTTVGPPTSINVSSSYGSLTVTFIPPFESTSELIYYVCYWKSNKEKKVKYTRSTSIALHDLDPWTEYCLQVFAEYTIGFKNGTLSEIACNKTTATADAMAAFTAKILFPAIFAIVGLVVGCFILKQKFLEDIKHWLSPPFRIPLHIEEFLNEPKELIFASDLEKYSSKKDQYDKLSIVSWR